MRYEENVPREGRGTRFEARETRSGGRTKNEGMSARSCEETKVKVLSEWDSKAVTNQTRRDVRCKHVKQHGCSNGSLMLKADA